MDLLHFSSKCFCDFFFEIVKPFPSDEYQEQVNVLRDVKHVKHKFLGLNPLRLTELHDQLLAILNCIDT